MRNHLISVALGFVLGGLVLVPLAWQFQPGSQPNPDPVGQQLLGTSSNPSADSRLDPVTSGRKSLSLPGGALPPVDTRRRSVDRSAGGTLTASSDPQINAARRGWSQRSQSPAHWRQVLSSAALNRPQTPTRRGASPWNTQISHSAHSLQMGPTSAFETRSDVHDRFGVMGSMQLATLPRQEDSQLLALLPPTTRVDNEPSVQLPGVRPLDPVRTGSTNTPSQDDPVNVVPVGVRPTIGGGVATVPSANPLSPLAPFGPLAPASPIGSGAANPSAGRPSNPVVAIAPIGQGAPVNNGTGGITNPGATGAGVDLPSPPATPVVPPVGTAVATGHPGSSPPVTDEGVPAGGSPTGSPVTGTGIIVSWGGLVATPEPGSLVLLATGGIMLLRRTRR